MQYGMIAISGFFSLGFLLLSLSAPWEKIVEEANNASTNATIPKESDSTDEEDKAS